ncbi:MAG: CHAT domain-containing protein [Pyrinomonadaceae bacterium]
MVFLFGFLNYEGRTARASARTAADLEELADAASRRWTKQAYSEALELYLKAAEQHELSDQDKEAARCLREAAQIARALANYDVARSHLDRALRLDKSENNLAGQAASYSLNSMIARQTGNWDDCDEYAKLATQVSEKTGDPEAKAYASLAAGIFEFYYGDVDRSVPILEDALRSSSQVDDITLRTAISTSLAYSYVRIGDPASGFKDVVAAIDETRAAGNLRDQAIATFAYGYLLMQVGRFQESLNTFSEAESLFPDDFEWLERGKLYTNIGVVHENLGSIDLAILNRRKGYEFYGTAKHPGGQLAVLPSIARLEFKAGNRFAAQDTYAAALSLALKLEDKFYPGVIEEGLGDIAFEDGDFAGAIQKFQNAANTYKSINVRLARLDRSIGRSFEGLGDLAAARASYEKALLFNQAAQDQLAIAQNLFDLARLDQKTNDPSSAAEKATESLRMTEAAIRDVASRKLQAGFFSQVNERYKLLESLLMRGYGLVDSSASVASLQISEQSKARIALQNLILSESNFTADASPETVAKERDLRLSLNSKSDLLTNMLGQGTDGEKTNKLKEEIDELGNQLENLRSELRRKSPIYSAIKNPEPFDVGDFQANVLDEGSVLLEFSLGRDESYLWAVSKSEVSGFYLPSREVIDGRVDKLRGLLAQTGIKEGEAVEDYQNRIAAAESEYKTHARALSEELLGQAVDKFAGKRLIIVADGKLLYFPIGSLPMPGSGSDDPILLTNEVVYEPSASALKILKRERTGAKPEKDLLVFADPVFSKSDERLTGLDTTEPTIATTLLSVFRSGSLLDKLPRLPASEEEATSIRNVVGSGRTTVRSGFEANRQGVINSDIENYKVLHFATHGLIDEKRPELSGIVLSLYDKDGKAQDSGVIRLQDVYGLNLRSDLVVLSACETGIGKEVRGEGLMSLNNAFLQAGAKTVVSSLWKVDDTATKQLMTNFYQAIATEGLTASAALRKAQIAMYKDPRYASPFHWAAFTAQGDYQRVPGIATGYSKYAIVAAVIFVVAGIVFLTRRRKARSFPV